jgi:hypothetical protein
MTAGTQAPQRLILPFSLQATRARGRRLHANQDLHEAFLDGLAIWTSGSSSKQDYQIGAFCLLMRKGVLPDTSISP